MKISNTNIDMSSARTASQTREVSESLRAWVGGSRPDFEGRGTANVRPAIETSRVTLSDAAMKAQANQAEAVDSEGDLINSDPKLLLIQSLVEMLTGKKIRLFAVSMQSSSDALADVSNPNQATQRQAPAGYGIEYDRHEVYAETEQTSFSASGVIHTADGKEIAFSVDLTMQRSYQETSDVSLRMGDARQKQDPLILNFNGTAAQLTNLRFEFDLNSDGQAEQVKLAGGNSGFLALDRNNNGNIDNGSELFGATTGNGFQELALLDQDGNGWIDEGDAAFGQLLLWSKDDNGNDILAALNKRNVGALYLGNVSTSFDLKDSQNQLDGSITSTGLFLQKNGTAGTMQNIDLTV